MKPSASYARLSDNRSADEPTIEYQHRRNTEYLRELGYTTVVELEEPKGHRSGRFLAQRPAMRDLMLHLSEYAAIAFFDFTRFARNLRFAFDFIESAAKCDTRLYNTSSRKEITVNNASEFIEVGVQSMFAEYESIQGTDRMNNAYTRARENGWVWSRRAPLGLRLEGSKESRAYQPSEDFPVIVEFFNLLADGESVYQCAVILRSRGYHARNVAGQKVMLQPYHLFKVTRNLETYKPFVDHRLYDMAERRLSERLNHQSSSRPIVHPAGILRHLLICSECHTRFRLSYDSSGDHWNAYYRHLQEYVCVNRRRVPRSVLDEKVFKVLSEFIREHPIEQPVTEPERDTSVERRKEIERLLSNLRRILMMGTLTESDIEDFNKQKMELERELETLNVPHVIQHRLSPEVLQAASAIAMLPVEKLREKATSKPVEFNLFLRDIFDRIILYPDNRCEFVFLTDWHRSSVIV